MTLQESEKKLSELNTEIDKLLKEREAVLKDENIGDNHILYLVNGGSKMLVCRLNSYDLEDSIQEFYKHINTSMAIQNIANNRESESPKYQKNLIYVKAIEIRNNYINRVME